MSDLEKIKLSLVFEQILSGQPVKVMANGFSMTPLIRDGDILVIKRPDSLHPGDIVAFLRSDMLFIHRLIKMDNHAEFAITKGDNLGISDKMLNLGEIIGMVIQVNEVKIDSRKILSRFFFMFYRVILLFYNKLNMYENNRLVQIVLSPRRFRISEIFLKLYRFSLVGIKF